jgi:hypothetical protein
LGGEPCFGDGIGGEIVRVVWLTRFALVLVLTLMMLSPTLARDTGIQTAHADDELPDPPALGDIILEDALADGKVIPTGICPTGKGIGETVGEGLILKVRGPCRPEDKESSVQVLMRGLGVQDGEVAIEFKTVQGGDRAGTYLYIQVAGRSWLAGYLNPAEGTARLLRSVDGQISTLGTREDLDPLVDPGDWNRAALRASGTEVWLLVNDEPLLYSDDAALGAGRAGIGLTRSGPLTDGEEAAVVLRNLTVTALADGDPARVPVYQAP